MSVSKVPSLPDYTASGDSKWIPWVFSTRVMVKFYDDTIMPNITNSDYEGEVKNKGDKVIIRTVPTVAVRNYVKGQTTVWHEYASDNVELTVNRAKEFNFKMDAIDIKQVDIDWMSQLETDAAQQMKIAIETDFFADIYSDAAAANKGTTAGAKSSSFNLGTTTTPIVLTKNNILDIIADCSTVADEQNWPMDGRYIVLPTWATNLLSKSELRDAGFAGDGKSRILRMGDPIMRINEFDVYRTNLYTAVSDSGYNCYNVLFGHKSGICYVSQLTKTEYFEKLETTFGSGMKGLNVYDWNGVKPESIGVLYARKG